MHPSYPSSIKRPGKGRNAKCPEACSDGIDDDADNEEAQAYHEDAFRDDKDIMEIRIHEGVGIEMALPVENDRQPCPEVDEGDIECRVNHPCDHGVPVHFALVYEENVVDHHQDRNDVMEYAVVKGKVFVADVVQLVGPYGARPHDEMVHERQCPKARCDSVAEVGGLKNRHVHFHERRAQPEYEQGKCGKCVVLDS